MSEHSQDCVCCNTFYGVYEVPAYCSNCGWHGKVFIARGTAFTDGAKCPHCALKRFMCRATPRRSWWFGRGRG